MITDEQIIHSINNIKFKRTESIFNRLTEEEQKYILNNQFFKVIEIEYCKIF